MWLSNSRLVPGFVEEKDMKTEAPGIVKAASLEGGIPEKTLEELYEYSGGDDVAFVKNLVSKGYLPSRQAYMLLAQELGLPFEEVDVSMIERSIMEVIPEDISRRFKAVPLRWEDGALVTALENPLDLSAIDALQEIVGTPIMPVVSTPESIEAGLDYRLNNEKGIESLLESLDLDKISDSSITNPQKLREIAGDDAIVQLVDYLLDQALRKKSSDIHIEPDRNHLRVRFRIDGKLETMTRLPKTLHPAIISRIKVLSMMDIAERRKPQDGRFQKQVFGKKLIEFRVSTLPAVFGEKAVLRILDKSRTALDLEDLGFSKVLANRLKQASESPYGMVLVTGPTGSGKTTTLYALLSHLNTEDRNIITIEDPVEYELPGITQVQVDNKADRTFASVLRSILRQDPDVIMVGEIRDRETAELAVQASLTGHMVLSTLHTNNSIGTVTRLLDMGIESYLLAPALRAVVAQRLVRRLCSSCSEIYDPPEILLEKFGIRKTDKKLAFRKPRGCSVCKEAGFVGRVPIIEVLPWTRTMEKLLVRGAGEQDLLEEARKAGFRPMLLDGAMKAWKGFTTLEEVIASARI